MSKFSPSSEAKLAGGMDGSILPDHPIGTDALRLSHAIGGRPDEGLITDHIEVKGVDTFDDQRMLKIAQQCFTSSEDYFNATQRTRIMDAMARFRSQHPKGSKYWSESFARRSKLFRPKTRAVIRKREAATVAALFSSHDVVNLSATASGDPQAAKDARIQDALLNARLTNDDRWYKLVVGSIQDADRQGIMIGTTEWEYSESTRYFDEHDPVRGRIKHKVKAPAIDRPNWRLVPIENLRMSPGCNWMDPVNSSPYLIELRPMYVHQIREMMANPRSRLKYRDLSDAELMMGASQDDYDPIRVQREGGTLDRYARNGELTPYSIVWVHRNIVRIEGEDYVYDTIGTTVMLSDVVPLSALDPRGYRPYVIGSAMVEAHNPYPQGAATLMGPLQDAIDTNANLRVDANNLATSGRMFVKRTAGIDLHALARFSPGSAVEMDDPQSVKWDRPPAPPQSNIEENNLLNTELDNLIGNFDQGSAARHPLNDTVGGMGMLADTSSQIMEYDLHTAAKTFFEPMLRQIMDLLRLWETDRAMAVTIGSKFAISERQYWNALQTPTQLDVDVGYSATNPMKRLEKLTIGLKTMAEMFPYLMMMADQSEITSEIFAACGYADATRFFPFLDQKDMDDPKYKTLIMQLNQMRMLSFPHIAEAQGRQQQGQAQAQGAITAAQIRAQSALQIARENNKAKLELRQLELNLAKVELQLEEEKNAIARDQLMMQREKLSSDIVVAQEQLALSAQGTPTAPDHAQEEPLTPDMQALVQALRQPGSGDVPVQSTQQAFRNAQDIPNPDDAMTAADLNRMMNPSTPPVPHEPARHPRVGEPTDQGIAQVTDDAQ
jgi:hypothetical protein